MLKLKERWSAFATALFDPWVIILLFCTIYLSLTLIAQKDVKSIAILTILVGLFSSVLGGIVTKRWDDLTEEKVLVTRAKSAHRSLELILSSIITLERRIRLYIERQSNPQYKKRITTEVIKTYFEEIVEDCVGLEEKVVNSIEDWKDILPNLELTTVLNLIRELNGNYSNSLAKLEQVNASLKETKDKSEDDVRKLEIEKKELSTELLNIQNELRKKSDQIGVRGISDSLITSSTGGAVALGAALASFAVKTFLYTRDNKPLDADPIIANAESDPLKKLASQDTLEFPEPKNKKKDSSSTKTE